MCFTVTNLVTQLKRFYECHEFSTECITFRRAIGFRGLMLLFLSLSLSFHPPIPSSPVFIGMWLSPSHSYTRTFHTVSIFMFALYFFSSLISNGVGHLMLLFICCNEIWMICIWDGRMKEIASHKQRSIMPLCHFIVIFFFRGSSPTYAVYLVAQEYVEPIKRVRVWVQVYSYAFQSK